VIPAEFDYVAPDTLDAAVRALSDGGDEAKLLAGGHSLLPLMKLRLATPSLLIDLRNVPGLAGIERTDGGWEIGALTTHRELEHAPELGIISRAAGTIADPQVRNRGTIGGSLAHGDPAADLPAVLLIAHASVTLRGPAGERSIAASELFHDYLETSVAADEVLTRVDVPTLDGFGFGYEKFNRRSEDWAMVAVSAMVKDNGGAAEDVRIGLTNMGPVPLRASAAESALRGRSLSPENIAEAAEQAAEGTDPPADLNASGEYKQHLARVLCRRAVERAVGLAS
jgi:aerobic carbon-monoxide dehydrogenase medium subunit